MSSTKNKWSNEQAYNLLQAMVGYRPYGIERHFHMMFILERFRMRSGSNVSAESLWDHIREYYDIDQLGEREAKRFDQEPVDYFIPDDL